MAVAVGVGDPGRVRVTDTEEVSVGLRVGVRVRDCEGVASAEDDEGEFDGVGVNEHVEDAVEERVEEGEAVHVMLADTVPDGVNVMLSVSEHVTDAVGDAVREGVDVGVDDAEPVGLEDGTAVFDAVRVAERETEPPIVMDGDGVRELVAVAELEGVVVGEEDGVPVGLVVGVRVGVADAEGVAVEVGVRRCSLDFQVLLGLVLRWWWFDLGSSNHSLQHERDTITSKLKPKQSGFFFVWRLCLAFSFHWFVLFGIRFGERDQNTKKSNYRNTKKRKPTHPGGGAGDEVRQTGLGAAEEAPGAACSGC